MSTLTLPPVPAPEPAVPSSPAASSHVRGTADAARTAAAPRGARTRSREELHAIALAGAAELGDADAEEIVEWAARTFALPAVAVASSMANAVLPHVVSQRLPGVDVVFLDTGYHFEETLRTRDEVAAKLDVRIVDVHPEQTVAEQDATFGPELYRRDPGLCCRLRKVLPLERTLARYEGWFTGLRRSDSTRRSTTPVVQWDERHGLVKINPLATWSTDRLLAYAAEHAVPVNPLLAVGYPSIGCAPCTSPVADGDDPRSGRWAGLAKTECGIHL